MIQRSLAVFTLIVSGLMAQKGGAVEIPVTKRFSELIAAEAQGKEGQRFRVGIERAKAASSGPVLVYVLCDRPLSPFSREGGGYRLVWAARTEKEAELQRLMERVSPADEGPFMILRSLVVPVGGGLLELLDASGQCLARRRIETEGRFHSFHPLGRDQRPQSELAAGDWPRSSLRLTLSGPAHPQRDGEQIRSLPSLRPESALPRSLPLKPTRGFELEPRGSLLRMRFPKKELISGLQYRLLVRLWVAGKPKSLPRPERGITMSGGGLEIRDDKVELDLSLDRSELQIPADARVELQLLYCPEGWGSVLDYEIIGPVAELEDELREPLLSQRVEFTGGR